MSLTRSDFSNSHVEATCVSYMYTMYQNGWIWNFSILSQQFHHHHISFMELSHLLTRSSLTYPEVSSKVYHDSFCQMGSSISLPWVIYFEAFYLHVVSSFSCIPVICPKLVLFLTPLQFVHLFCNLSKCKPQQFLEHNIAISM